jgi:hypothetical protein
MSIIKSVVVNATLPMSEFEIDRAKTDFKKKVDDDKARIRGRLDLDLFNGDAVEISEGITVTVGPLSVNITMVEMGKNGKRWVY